MAGFAVILHIHFDTSLHVGESVFLIGSLNQWQKEGTLLGTIPKDNQTMTLVLDEVPEGILEFRLTRGSWLSINCSTTGKIEKPFHFLINENVDLDITINAWRDDFPSSTATEQVQTMSENFYFPSLNVYRKVWIYLPLTYDANALQSFPVLYMHDGQHLFDEAVAVGRKGPVEWQVDKAINQSIDDAIVVAIAHGGEEKDRLKDYAVHPVEGMPNPMGRAYLSDIAHVLKPFVDKNYNTNPEKKYTAMAGSSLGGLLSLYAGLYYPEVFGYLGVFSPSLWLDNGQVGNTIVNELSSKKPFNNAFYFYGGGLENRKIKDKAIVEMDKDIDLLIQKFQRYVQKSIAVDINPIGKHGALYWQQAFPAFFSWWQAQMKSVI